MKELYDEDYFERGLQLGISGYTSYSWMPELTLKMASFLIAELKLTNKKVLDFGCAKGYLVKALRSCGIEAFGYDVSKYATTQAPQEIKQYCYWGGRTPISNILSSDNIDFIISKDVFEHLNERQLKDLLKDIKNSKVNEVYVVVPVSKHDDEEYIIAAYENDKTHLLRKSVDWWEKTLKETLGFTITMSSNKHGPIKENWTKTNKDGNLFIKLQR